MNFFKKFFKQDDKSNLKPIGSTNSYLSNVWDDSYRSAFDNAYRSISYSCMKIRADACSSLKYLIYTKNSQLDKTPVNMEHWLMKLLNDPNPLFRKTEFFKLLQMNLDYFGNTYIYVNFSDNKLPIQMWILDSEKITIKIDEYGYPQYILNDSGGSRVFLEDEIIHIRNIIPSKNNKFLGTSLVSIAADLINADKDLNNSISRQLNGTATSKNILKITDRDIDFTPESWDVFKQKWNTINKNSKLISTIGYGMDIQEIKQGLENTNINIKDLDEILKKKLAMIFGIPFSKLTGENTTFASAKLADWTFRVDTIRPLAIQISEALTKYFSKFESDIVVDFEDFTYDDQDFKLKRDETYLKNGIKNINEIRNEIGLDEIEGGDIRLISSSYQNLNELLNQKEEENKKNIYTESDSEKNFKVELIDLFLSKINNPKTNLNKLISQEEFNKIKQKTGFYSANFNKFNEFVRKNINLNISIDSKIKKITNYINELNN